MRPQHFTDSELTGATKTNHAADLAYVYRLEDADGTAAEVITREGKVEFPDLPVGDYIFQVQAVDRDLNYSEPARVRVRVHPPYERLAWMSGLALALALVLVLVLSLLLALVVAQELAVRLCHSATTIPRAIVTVLRTQYQVLNI